MWSDRESKTDYLNFSEVSQLAVDILTSPHMLPISIGIFGNWGSGKSTLLNLLENDLINHKNDFIIAKFDAWLYQGFDDSRAALLETVARSLDNSVEENESLKKKVSNLIKRTHIFRLLGFFGEATALAKGIPTGGLIATGANILESTVANFSGDDDLTQDESSSLLRISKTPPQHINEFRKEYSEILKELQKPLVVIIDNLDRCLPTKAIQILEGIRLILFLENTAFVIAADEEMVRGAVASYFENTSVRHQIDYLDKLIQVPIRVPKAGVREIRSYLFMLYAIEYGVQENELEKLRRGLEESLQASWKNEPIDTEEAIALTNNQSSSELSKAFDLANRIAPILAHSPIIHGNPRIVKRLLNVVKMRLQTTKRRNIPIDVGIITKLVIFERCAGSEATADLYKMIDRDSGKPEILKKLEKTEITELPKDSPKSWQATSTKDFILEWCKLEPKLGDIDLIGAVYLSRETMPIGVYVIGLSPKGKEVLATLAEVRTLSSPAGKEAIANISLEDQVPVMEGLLERLRKITDWDSRPLGFDGACLLAQKSPEAASVFKSFVRNLDQSVWMKSMLDQEEWYNE